MDKIDKFFAYILVLALGVGLGMWWRMAQVGSLTTQIELLQQERREIKGSIISLETRLKILEKKIGRK